MFFVVFRPHLLSTPFAYPPLRCVLEEITSIFLGDYKAAYIANPQDVLQRNIRLSADKVVREDLHILINQIFQMILVLPRFFELNYEED